MIQNPVPWPDGARCAVAFTFDMDAESIMHLAHPDDADNRIAGLSELRYGPDVAMPRIIEVFRRHGLRQTFFIPGWCIEKYPRTIEIVLEHGHEIGHHGYLHENPNQIGAEDEAYWLDRALDTLVAATGERPKGYRAPNYGFSRHTLRLLVERGFDYDASLMGDDVPYLIEDDTGLIEDDTGSLVELPSCRALDDWTHFMLSRDFDWMLPVVSPERGFESYRAEFDAMWKYRGMWIAVWHPFVSGRPARCDQMETLIGYMEEKGGVWFATLEEISTHVRACIADGRWTPRRERVPWVTSPISELERGGPADA